MPRGLPYSTGKKPKIKMAMPQKKRASNMAGLPANKRNRGRG